jgi:uncharacterized membrane protein
MDETTQTPQEIASDKGAAKMAQIIYFLYLATLVIQIAHFVGAVMAYLNKDENSPWIETHFRYQIRTFWMYTLYLIIAAVTAFAGVGVFVFLCAAVWLVIRCATGMKYLYREQAVPNPTTWLW